MKSMQEQFNQWKSALDAFQDSVEKDLEEIRRHKSDVQKMKIELLNQLDSGQYIRDENRIVISAPEIIIGNVDKSGVLWDKGSPSKVVIRGNNVALEATGIDSFGGGSIVSRASSIRQVAVDPGKDGIEQVVCDTSEVVSQARNIVLQSDKADGVFSQSAYPCAGSGIRIHADERIELEATQSNEIRKKWLGNRKSMVKNQVGNLKKQSEAEKKQIDSVMKDLEKLLSGPDLNLDETLTRTNYVDIDNLHSQFKFLSETLYYTMTSYFKTLSMLAEANRQSSSLTEQEEQVDKLKDKFKEETTGAAVCVRTERLEVVSMDGDGNLRTNPEAGVGVVAKNVNVRSVNRDGSLMEDSVVNIRSQNVTISTDNPKVDRNDEGELQKADLPAIGDVRITSKNITLEAVDKELKSKDEEITEKALTAEGRISLRAESMQLAATDTEGKATGQISLNGKAVELKSMDVDKEKGTDTGLAAGSSMVLLSEKMFAGSKDPKTKSQSVQIASDKVGIFADSTAEVQQGDGKAVVQLDGGDVSLSGGKASLYGETTLNGKTAFKADVTAGKMTVDNIEVKTSFKTPCTTEGIAVPAPPSTDKLSAKLKEEEAPKAEAKS